MNALPSPQSKLNQRTNGRTANASGHFIRALLLLGLFISLSQTFGGELLRNGSFTDGLQAWKVDAAWGTWSPLQTNYVGIHPPGSGATGTILSQSLNVSNIANQSVVVSCKLRKVSAPSGKTAALYLQYVTTGNQVRRVKVLNPANDTVTDWAAFSANYTFPADARKLTGLMIAKEDYGDFHVDDVSVTSSVLTTNVVPVITTSAPVRVPYGTLITLDGQDFGTNPDLVNVFGSSAGVSVQTWTDTRVTLSLQEPARNGRITLLRDFVEADGGVDVQITSPNFTADVLTTPVKVIKGTVANILLKVDMLNGFVTPNGVTMQLPGNPTIATFTPVPLRQSGGVMMKIDTATLAAGTNLWDVQSAEANSVTRSAPFELQVVTVAEGKFYSSGQELLGPLTISAQGEFYGLSFALFDATAAALDTSAATLTSGDPSILLVTRDPAFGNYRLFANENGSTTLTVSTPDGYSKQLTVNVTLPSSPKVTVIGLNLPTMTNRGDQTNTFFAQGTGQLGIGWEGLSLTNANTTWFDANTRVESVFQIAQGSAPGPMLLRAYTFTGSFQTGTTETSRRYVALEIVNDPARGQLVGSIRKLESGTSGPMHMMGNLEVYEAGAQNLVQTQMVYLFGPNPDFVIPYLPPGSYKARFVPGDNRLLPQWYPNASSHATAGALNVTAGSTVRDVHFFLHTITLSEAVDFSVPDLFTSGSGIIGLDTGWFGQSSDTHDGVDAARSPMLADNGVAFIEGTVVGPGTVSFWWKVSSETNADTLSFQADFAPATRQTISGEVGWTQVFVTLDGAGPHTLSWQYQKNASGSAGMDGGWVDQIVFTPQTGTSAPTIVSPPQSQTVKAGQNVSFTVSATGTPPLAFQWRQDGTNLTGATETTLTLSNVNTNEAGNYTVVITNSFGAITSAVATLTVQVPPQITLGLPPALTNNVGDTVQFGVTATGTGPLAYQWLFGNSLLPDATNNSLALVNVQPTQAGNYRIVITNVAGAVTSSVAVLTVVSLPPSIITPPMSQSFAKGGGLTLSVTAAGTGPLYYQWQFNGTNLVGATDSTLLLANLTAAYAGAYRVVISNAVGTIASVPADLYFFGELKFIAATVLAGSVGQKYRVDYTDVVNVGTTNWLVLTNVTLPYSPFLVVDPDSAGKAHRYYRAVPLP
ncbi:MAG: hypothetical protein EBS84_01985 [Proteobacteria bacterium]|nr:hypothetical protein [Verrucomicrobiota bacterium]NBU07780.1 hypothetical protein [Pseudomonadota bacterium]